MKRSNPTLYTPQAKTALWLITNFLDTDNPNISIS